MELIDKVRIALISSGFPLEMKIANVLKNSNWSINVGSRYEDFETGVLRELDVTASKSINRIEVHLFIECKKSDNKQLVLYAPTHNRSVTQILSPLRYFPKPESITVEKQLNEVWKSIPLLDESVPISNGIIFTKGEKIEQGNDSFFSSLNGIVKKSIIIGSDGYIETGFRMIFFHILVYDGIIYQVSNIEDKDFELTEINYGQYEFPYRFKFPINIFRNFQDIVQASHHFRFSNLIEIIHPNFFEVYLQKIQSAISQIPKDKFEGWGISMEDFYYEHRKATGAEE
ncbi:hypothetical protein ACFOET_17980 [Parapedobacter deserti]|uniref:Uncharacterized protein n=1 Tax=Parapedobacter deserti TaxID=1912957 RepID=A0ABV7JW52_9SPHI